MSIAVCGLNCGICEHFEKNCKGCQTHAGKVFWAEAAGLPACPIYACAAAKGYSHCGQCAQMPCGIWEGLREDHVTDEEHAANLAMRQQNLKGLAPQ